MAWSRLAQQSWLPGVREVRRRSSDVLSSDPARASMTEETGSLHRSPMRPAAASAERAPSGIPTPRCRPHGQRPVGDRVRRQKHRMPRAARRTAGSALRCRAAQAAISLTRTNVASGFVGGAAQQLDEVEYRDQAAERKQHRDHSTGESPRDIDRQSGRSRHPLRLPAARVRPGPCTYGNSPTTAGQEKPAADHGRQQRLSQTSGSSALSRAARSPSTANPLASSTTTALTASSGLTMPPMPAESFR